MDNKFHFLFRFLLPFAICCALFVNENAKKRKLRNFINFNPFLLPVAAARGLVGQVATSKMCAVENGKVKYTKFISGASLGFSIFALSGGGERELSLEKYQLYIL